MQFVQVDLEWQHEHDQQVDNLEMYGVDWQDLTNQQVVESHLANNPVGSEPLTLWIRSGLPPKLNAVRVEPPVLDQDPSDFFIGNAIPRIQPYIPQYRIIERIFGWRHYVPCSLGFLSSDFCSWLNTDYL